MNKGFFWYVIVLLTLACLTLVHCVYGEGWPTNYQHFNDIRTLVRSLPVGTHLRVTLNTGDTVFVEYLNYEKYNDYLWYQPQNTTSWLSQDAFDIHEIATVEVVEPL